MGVKDTGEQVKPLEALTPVLRIGLRILYLCKFSKKLDMVLLGLSGVLGMLIHKKI
jgi:hypothetical protein